MDESKRTYLIVHAADWLAIAAIGYAAVRWSGIPAWIPLLIGVGWIAKDLLSYPLLRCYYESEPPQKRMIDNRGEAMTRLAPDGQVRVRGEIWEASLVDRTSTLERGESVRVRGINGLMLLVERDSSSS
jgi:membrane protein implicated in regulation of membrane protease activity